MGQCTLSFVLLESFRILMKMCIFKPHVQHLLIIKSIQTKRTPARRAPDSGDFLTSGVLPDLHIRGHVAQRPKTSAPGWADVTLRDHE